MVPHHDHVPWIDNKPGTPICFCTVCAWLTPPQQAALERYRSCFGLRAKSHWAPAELADASEQELTQLEELRARLEAGGNLAKDRMGAGGETEAVPHADGEAASASMGAGGEAAVLSGAEGNLLGGNRERAYCSDVTLLHYLRARDHHMGERHVLALL